MALTMNLVSAESVAEVKLNPSGQHKMELEQVDTQENDIAVYSDGLRFVDVKGDQVADDVFGYGFAGATPLVGDFNKDGTDDIVLFCDGLWFVDVNGDHLADDVLV
jgi:hypothetical protein